MCKTLYLLSVLFVFDNINTLARGANSVPGYTEEEFRKHREICLYQGCYCAYKDMSFIVCESWLRFVKLGSHPEFRPPKTARLKLTQKKYWRPNLNTEFIDVKDHETPESVIAKKENLTTLTVDIDKLVAFKEITNVEITEAPALKLINPNFFRIFKSLSRGLHIHSMENLRRIPYIPISVGPKLILEDLPSLEVIKGCGEKVCGSYANLSRLVLNNWRSKTRNLSVEDLGLPQKIVEVDIIIKQPHVEIDPYLFTGREITILRYTTLGSVSALDLKGTSLQLGGYLNFGDIKSSSIHGKRLSTNFQISFFYNRQDKLKTLKLSGIKAGTLVAVISIPPKLNETGSSYQLCKRFNKYNYPNETLTSKDTKLTLRYVSIDIVSVLEIIPNSVTDLTIYTLHAVISKNITVRSSLKFTLYYVTMFVFQNSAVYESAPKDDPSLEDFNVKATSVENTKEIDPVFAQIAFVCTALIAQAVHQKEFSAGIPLEDTIQWKIFQSMPMHF